MNNSFFVTDLFVTLILVFALRDNTKKLRELAEKCNRFSCRKFYRIPDWRYDKMCKCHVSPFHFLPDRHTAFLDPVTRYTHGCFAIDPSPSTWSTTFQVKSRVINQTFTRYVPLPFSSSVRLVSFSRSNVLWMLFVEK